MAKLETSFLHILCRWKVVETCEDDHNDYAPKKKKKKTENVKGNLENNWQLSL